jgi:hypothetical protein
MASIKAGNNTWASRVFARISMVRPSVAEEQSEQDQVLLFSSSTDEQLLDVFVVGSK